MNLFIFVYKGTRKRHKIVSIESSGQSDLEEKEMDMEVEKFSLPMFGDSPGPSPSVTPPTVPSSPVPVEEHTIKEVIEAVILNESSYCTFLTKGNISLHQ